MSCASATVGRIYPYFTKAVACRISHRFCIAWGSNIQDVRIYDGSVPTYVTKADGRENKVLPRPGREGTEGE